MDMEQRLLIAIERDDRGAFDALMEEARCGEYRLGRFPVLSLLYLYRARKILSAYENAFLSISQWRELHEPASAAKLFSQKAGKCLRLYLNEVVSPLEMLLILDRTRRLKKVYPLTEPSKSVRKRLQSIYSIKYALGVTFEGSEIRLDRRPLTRRERKSLLAAGVSLALAVAVAIVTPVTTTAVFGPRDGGEVSFFSHINFAADTTYTLTKDIKIPANRTVKEMNCTIEGNGHKLIFGKNATISQFGGELRDVEIQTAGSPIFTLCQNTAVLSNVTVNASVNRTANESSALIAIVNYGTFENVTLNVGGKMQAREASGGGVTELIFGGLVGENAYYSSSLYGTVKNCTVNYSDFTLSGELAANATFGGIVGINYGVVEDCTATGEITANTFDLAGICYANGGTLSRNVNEADLSQVSVDEGWSPIVGGIVIQNGNTVEACRNTGSLTVEGADTAICGGIVARNYGDANYCMSTGDIFVTAQTGYIGSIFGRSEALNDGRFGFADSCIGGGTIHANLTGENAGVGGIGGIVSENKYTVRDPRGNIIDENVYLGGSVTNCFYLGKIEGGVSCFGYVVGLCGEEIYSRDSYSFEGSDRTYRNFEKNYYIENGHSSFGGTVLVIRNDRTGEVEEERYNGPVAGKGASAATEDAIKDVAAYQEILEKLGMLS